MEILSYWIGMKQTSKYTHIVMTFRRDKQFCQAEDHANCLFPEALAEGNKCKFAWSEALTKLFIPEKSHDNKFIIYYLALLYYYK